jgi:hypothetical protein
MPVWNGLTQFGSFLGQRFSPRSELKHTRVRIALLIEDCGHMWVNNSVPGNHLHTREQIGLFMEHFDYVLVFNSVPDQS